MKIDVNINLAKLPATVVDAAIEASGATTPRALVLAGLKALAEQAGGSGLNERTRKAAARKSSRGDKVFETPDAFKAFLRERYS